MCGGFELWIKWELSEQREHPDSCVRNDLSFVELNYFCFDHSTWGSEQPYSPAIIKCLLL